MTTKIQKKAPTIVAGEGYKPLFSSEFNPEQIKIEGNFRKHFNEKALTELAENIAKVGVLQPIILRTEEEGFPKAAKDGKFILVAGERRLRAAILAGLKKIPGRVLDLTADQAIEVQALENLHRKDLTPLEEARCFKALLDQKGHTLAEAQELADRVDKSLNYVYRAVRLLELPEKVLSGIDEGTLTATHGHQMLRASKEHWDELTKSLFSGDLNDRIVTAAQFGNEVEDVCGKDLKSAYFPKDKAYGNEGACAACQFNSGNQGQLFEGAEKGKCMDTVCFIRKQNFWIAEAIAQSAEYAEKVGLPYLGSGKQQGYCDDITFKGHKILSPAEAEKAKDPKKYSVGFVTGGASYTDVKPRTVTVLLTTKKNGSTNSGYDWKKDNFIRSAVTHAINEAEAIEAVNTIKATSQVYDEVVVNLLKHRHEGYIAKALGVKKIKTSLLNDDQLAAIMIYCSRDYGWHPKKKQIEKDAIKKALEEYKAR